MILIVAAALASSHAKANSTQCEIRIGALVPTEQVAKELALAVIRGRQKPEETAKFELHVQRDPDEPRTWVVFQSIPDSLPDANGNIEVTVGGGGLGMRIDGCNGRISEAYYQR